ncbi:MAG: hypothetical protein HUN05_03795 [Desulfobacter sp.]|nr:MAG: hypothetical protein HUN05_03795 [Desulfobacter sp.]
MYSYLSAFPAPPLFARQVQKDLDNDKINDQVLTYNSQGILLRVETDMNHDGFSEQVQVYEKGRPVLVTRDLDNDCQMDCKDYFQKGKLIRQERFSPKGKRVQISLFDAQEQVCLMKKDTTGDEQFDTLYYFKAGRLTHSTQDLDANKTPNLFTWYKNQMPVRREKDEDENGIREEILLFDGKGQMAKQMKQPFDKERYEEIILFEQGMIKTRNQDKNHDSQTDEITWFKNGRPDFQKTDHNFNGAFDTHTRFENGVIAFQEKDTNHDGKFDFFTVFDAKGRIKKIQEDTQHTGKIDKIRHFTEGDLRVILLDHDQNGVFETQSLVKEGQVRQSFTDKNQDKVMDQTIFFSATGAREKLADDTNFNGRPDMWQFYKNNGLERLERDENGDGKTDLKVFYGPGAVKKRLTRDSDFNGYFETCQVYDDPQWTLVTTQDFNRDHHPDICTCYTGQVIRVKRTDEDLDGKIDLIEYYTLSGALEKQVEIRTKNASLTWFYNQKDTPERAEEDLNGDGKTDTWYFYAKGMVTRVEEDSNQDGQPDLWETYDENETLVKREKDLDFDGRPDFIAMPIIIYTS